MSIFSTVPQEYNVKRNVFPLSKDVLTTGELGCIYPVFTQFLVPNSFLKVTPNCVVKTAPMYAPIYSGIKVDFHSFVVPLRLLWEKFDDWIYDPENVSDVPPHISESNFINIIRRSSGVSHSLAFDLGVPNVDITDAVPSDNKVRSIWQFLAYHKIWSDYFRNERLQDEPDILSEPRLQDYDTFIDEFGLDSFVFNRQRNYAKDYFTSALPQPQNGVSPMLQVLNTLSAPLKFKYESGSNPSVVQGEQYQLMGVPGSDNNLAATLNAVGTLNAPSGSTDLTQVASSGVFYGYADLTDAGNTIDVAKLRSLLALQKYMEINATGGNRLPEGTLSYYGCHVPDYRAKRAEFLGMCSTYITPSEVVAHDYSKLGNLGAYGHGVGLGRSFRCYTTEHCIFMTVMSMRPNSLYCQGVPKTFSLLDQFDFPIPLFQHLGEEPVKNEELYYTGVTVDDEKIFGYQSRYAFWRSSYDEVKGDFVTSLKSWHLGRLFNTTPLLNEEFIQVTGGATQNIIDNTNMLNRIFNYTGKSEHFWIDMYFSCRGVLPFRYHSKPMLIG